METNRSSSYRFTVTDKSDPRLIDLKQQVSIANSLIPDSQRRLRVQLQGRAGKNNPHVKWQGEHRYGVPQSIATRFDVYVHTIQSRRDQRAEREAYRARKLANAQEFEAWKGRLYENLRCAIGREAWQAMHMVDVKLIDEHINTILPRLVDDVKADPKLIYKR